MPRGRRRKKDDWEPKPGSKVTPIVDKELVQIEKPEATVKKVDEPLNVSDLLDLEGLSSFLRTDRGCMAVCNLISTTLLAGDEMDRAKIESLIVDSLVDSARNRGMTIAVNKIHIKTHPAGAKTYVKAWFYLDDAGGRRMEQEKRQTMPREGLWVEEPGGRTR